MQGHRCRKTVRFGYYFFWERCRTRYFREMFIDMVYTSFWSLDALMVALVHGEAGRRETDGDDQPSSGASRKIKLCTGGPARDLSVQRSESTGWERACSQMPHSSNWRSGSGNSLRCRKQKCLLSAADFMQANGDCWPRYHESRRPHKPQ
jgi:hypothetical protein